MDAWMFVCHMHACCWRKPEGIGSCANGVTHGCELSLWLLGINSSPLEGQAAQVSQLLNHLPRPYPKLKKKKSKIEGTNPHNNNLYGIHPLPAVIKAVPGGQRRRQNREGLSTMAVKHWNGSL